MADMIEEIAATKFQIKYANNKGSFTFNKIKNYTTDEDIKKIAEAFVLLQRYDKEKIFKIIETNLI
jgi:hypothetical protein